MAWTFGGGTTDKVRVTDTGTDFPGPNTSTLVTGWFYPTTVTAGRILWAYSSTATGCRCEIGAGGTVIIRIPAATTAGVYTSVDAPIIANQWNFIAVYITVNVATPSAVVAIWSGTDTLPPIASSVTTTTAPVGTITSGFGFIIGNASSTSTTPFQGAISQVTISEFNAGPSGLTARNFFQVNFDGTLTAQQAIDIGDWLVLPLWQGNYGYWIGKPVHAFNFGVLRMFWPGYATDPLIWYQYDSDGAPTYTASVTGGSTSSLADPRQIFNNWDQPNKPRR